MHLHRAQLKPCSVDQVCEVYRLGFDEILNNIFNFLPLRPAQTTPLLFYSV